MRLHQCFSTLLIHQLSTHGSCSKLERSYYLSVGLFRKQKQQLAVRTARPTLHLGSVHDAVKHQILPVSQIAGMPPIAVKRIRCSVMRRTACAACKEAYCYDCGMIHLEGMLTFQYTNNEDILQDNDGVADTTASFP